MLCPSPPVPSTSAAQYSNGMGHPIYGPVATTYFDVDVTQGGYFTDFSMRAILMVEPLAKASRPPFRVTFYTEDVELPGSHHRELVQAGVETSQIFDAVADSEDSSLGEDPAFTSRISEELQGDFPGSGSGSSEELMTSPFSTSDSLYDSFDINTDPSDDFLSAISSPTASSTLINVGDLDDITGFYDSEESTVEVYEVEGSHLQRNEEAIPMPWYKNEDYDMAEDGLPSPSAAPASVPGVQVNSLDHADQSGGTGNHSIPMDCSDYDDSAQAGPSTSTSVIQNAPMTPMETSLLPLTVSTKEVEDLLARISENMVTPAGGPEYLPNAQFTKRPRKAKTTKGKKVGLVRNGGVSFSSNVSASADLKSEHTSFRSSDPPKEIHLISCSDGDSKQDLNGVEIAASSPPPSSSGSFEI